jgi:hypothetical protein
VVENVKNHEKTLTRSKKQRLGAFFGHQGAFFDDFLGGGGGLKKCFWPVYFDYF